MAHSISYDMDEVFADRLHRYVKQPSRHHLVFTSSDVNGLTYANIGYELANAIQGSSESDNIASTALQALYKILTTNVCIHPTLGNILAISNTPILLEPQLHIDIHSLFEQWSKSLCLIVRSEELVTANDFQELSPIII